MDHEEDAYAILLGRKPSSSQVGAAEQDSSTTKSKSDQASKGSCVADDMSAK